MADTRIPIKLDLNVSEFSGNVEQVRQIVQMLGKETLQTLNLASTQVTGFGESLGSVSKQIARLTKFVKSLPNSLIGMTSIMQQGFFTPFSNMMKGSASQFDALIGSFVDGIARVTSKLQSKSAIIQSSLGTDNAFDSLSAPAPQKKSTGGAVFGSGTDTSDSIPALLSNNEYVIRASSVKKYGLRFMDLLNRGIYEESILRFNDGGLAARKSWLKRSIELYQSGQDVSWFDPTSLKVIVASFKDIMEYMKELEELETRATKPRPQSIPLPTFSSYSNEAVLKPSDSIPVNDEMIKNRIRTAGERNSSIAGKSSLEKMRFTARAGTPEETREHYRNSLMTPEILRMELRNEIHKAIGEGESAAEVSDLFGDISGFLPKPLELPAIGVGLGLGEFGRWQANNKISGVEGSANQLSQILGIDLSSISKTGDAGRDELSRQRIGNVASTAIGLGVGKLMKVSGAETSLDQGKKWLLPKLNISEGSVGGSVLGKGIDGAAGLIAGWGAESAIGTVSGLSNIKPQVPAQDLSTPLVQSTTRVKNTVPFRSIAGPSIHSLDSAKEPEHLIQLKDIREKSEEARETIQDELFSPLQDSSEHIGKDFLNTTDVSVDSLKASAEGMSDELGQIEDQHNADKLQRQEQTDEQSLQQQQQALADREALIRGAYAKVSEFMSFGANASEARAQENKRYQEQMADFKGSLIERHDAQVAHEQKLKEIDEQAKQERFDMVKNYLLQELSEIAIQELAKLSLKATSETSQTAVQEAGVATRSGLAATESGSNLFTAASSIVSAVANAIRWVFTTIPFPFSFAVAGAAVAAVYGLWEGARSMFGFAEGGHVLGPGTETSDSIPSLLSNNEYVVKASSVKDLGVGTLDYINAHGALPLAGSKTTVIQPAFGLQRPVLSSTSVGANGALLSKLDSLERTVANLQINAILDQNKNNLSSQQARAIRKAKAY